MKKQVTFRKGETGNANGRPLTAYTVALREHWSIAIKVLTDKVRDGDLAALRIYFDHTHPKPKPRAEPVVLEGFDDTSNPEQQGKVLAEALAAGKTTTDEAANLAAALTAQARLIESTELAKRIEALEKRNG